VVLEDIADALDIDVNPIGFDGAGDQMNAVIAGDVDLAILSPGAFMSYVESGEIEPLLMSSVEEYLPEELQDVAVPEDLGIDREFPLFWRNFFAPPELDDAEIAYWLDSVEAWTESEDYTEYLETNYLVPEFQTGEELEERMQADHEYITQGAEGCLRLHPNIFPHPFRKDNLSQIERRLLCQRNPT